MRILCVTLLYPPHHLGGYERCCEDVLSRLAARGHEVLVLTSDERQPGVADPPGEGTANPAVRRELRSYHRQGQLLTPPIRERLAIERTNQAALARSIADLDPDVVTPWHMGALSVGLLTAIARSGRPVVYGICDDWPTYAEAVDPWMRLFRGRRALGRIAEQVTGVPCVAPDLGATGTFCFLSQTTRERCASAVAGRPDDSTVIYSGIDRTVFTASGDRRDFSWKMLYAGRPDARKGIATLLRAMPYLPRAALTVYVPLGMLAGDGRPDDPDVAQLRVLAADLGVAERVCFVEGTGRSAMVDQYRRADVVVFPSEWPEPLGLVPLEAMACGIPVVATGVGGSGEFLVDGANCVQFAPGDAVALAAGVERIAGDAELRARLHAGGLATARELDTDTTADEYEAWFQAAVDRFRGGRPPLRRLSLPEPPAASGPTVAPVPPPLVSAVDGAAPDVRVGIVSWNTAALLDQCLAALPAALGRLRAEVVVVDNASADGSADAAAAHPGVTVVRNATNVGYAKAMNRALADTAAPVLIALNPDTVPAPGSLATLVRRLHEQPDVGLVAPKLTYEDGRLQHSVFRWPSPAVALTVAFVPPRFQPGAIGRHFWLVGASPHDESTDIDWVIGAVHVIRRAALAGAAPYDERWFMYVEDIELCWRLAEAGWRRRLEADVTVMHVSGASSRQVWDDPAPIYFRATYDWYARDRGAAAARRWALANTVGVAWRVVSLRAIGVLTESPSRVHASRALRPMFRVHLGALRRRSAA